MSDNPRFNLETVRAYSLNLATQLATVWNANAEFLTSKGEDFDVRFASITAGLCMFFDRATKDMPDSIFDEMLGNLREERQKEKI